MFLLSQGGHKAADCRQKQRDQAAGGGPTKCIHCGKTFNIRGLAKHEQACLGMQQRAKEAEPKPPRRSECMHCGKAFGNGLYVHEQAIGFASFAWCVCACARASVRARRYM